MVSIAVSYSGEHGSNLSAKVGCTVGEFAWYTPVSPVKCHVITSTSVCCSMGFLEVSKLPMYSHFFPVLVYYASVLSPYEYSKYYNRFLPLPWQFFFIPNRTSMFVLDLRQHEPDAWISSIGI